MPDDSRPTAARQAHREAVQAGQVAERARTKRDGLVRALRAEDPARWSYGALAKAVGCSRELIAVIVRGR